ncbi:hypothetical protein MMC30_007875 [Trapelia coarctata]|nr:hypothetical protein [Trapelia coarctata]
MTLTGACPGTVFPQLAVGILSGLFVLLGGILGGVLWVTFRTSLRQGSQPVHAAQSIGSKGNGERTGNRNPTLSPALMAYISLCLLAITVATFLAPFTYAAPIHPILGGLLIGAAQASSILLTGSTLGVSTAYEDAAAWLRYWIQNSESANPPQTSRSDKASKPFPRPPTKSLCFVVGVLAGSYSVLKLSPHQLASRSFGSVGEGIAEGDVQVGKLTAVLGGCIMIFGARLAGGCTSGHGISGMAMLGPASFVTVGGMFVGGMGLAVLRG